LIQKFAYNLFFQRDKIPYKIVFNFNLQHYPADMNILLLVAHGSRREESNLEVESLSKKMIQYSSSQFDVIMPAFLEFASPSIPEAIEKCSDMGANHVTVLPYFLSAGVHINRDIPGEIEKASQKFPNLEINITDYFGSRKEIAELLMKTAVGN